jgi:outer membrane receptor for ferrienterochelin and colicin
VSNTLLLSFSVVLIPRPEVLATVDVSAKRRRQWIEEFYQRRIRGSGAFVTRDDILTRHASVLTDMLRTMPGLQVVRTRAGQQGVRFAAATNGRRDCMPMIWLDGQKVPGMEVDQISINDIEGVELYRGSSITPPQFWDGGGPSCGTIVVWTRNPGG